MTVQNLHMTETAESDVWRLVGRQDSFGAPSPEIEPALEELAEYLSRAVQAWRLERTEELSAAVADLAQRSSRLGLNRLCRVARTIGSLCGSGDDTALAANVARLERLGHATLTDIWRLQDVP